MEGERVSTDLELGLDVTPWGPLQRGELSVRYPRDPHGKTEAGHGAPFAHGGNTCDDHYAGPWPASPKDDNDR